MHSCPGTSFSQPPVGRRAFVTGTGVESLRHCADQRYRKVVAAACGVDRTRCYAPGQRAPRISESTPKRTAQPPARHSHEPTPGQPLLSSPPLGPTNSTPGMHRADLFLPPTPTSGRLQVTRDAEHCGPVRESEARDREKKAKHQREPVEWPPRTRTVGDGGGKGRGVVYGERSGAGSRGLGGESASREGRGWVRERAEEEVSWRRAVEVLLAGSLLGNSWRTRRVAAAEWRRIESSRTDSRRPTSSRRWDSVSMCILSNSWPSAPQRPVPLTIRPAAGPGVPRTWRRWVGLR